MPQAWALAAPIKLLPTPFLSVESSSPQCRYESRFGHRIGVNFAEIEAGELFGNNIHLPRMATASRDPELGEGFCPWNRRRSGDAHQSGSLSQRFAGMLAAKPTLNLSLSAINAGGVMGNVALNNHDGASLALLNTTTTRLAIYVDFRNHWILPTFIERRLPRATASASPDRTPATPRAVARYAPLPRAPAPAVPAFSTA